MSPNVEPTESRNSRPAVRERAGIVPLVLAVVLLAAGCAALPTGRFDTLAAAAKGVEARTTETGRILQDQQDRLVKMALVAIVQEMEATNRKYQTAVKRVTEATEAIGDADESIQNVAEIISVVAKALDAAEGLLKKALVG
jgi:hypothetical protein